MKTSKLAIGYNNDVGTEIILDEDVTFKAGKVTTVNLHAKFKVHTNKALLVCPRSSAAKRGLYIATCPVDPDYSGDVHAVVFNCSDQDITYHAGESFCQVVQFNCTSNPFHISPKKEGKRTNGAFGSTDVSSK